MGNETTWLVPTAVLGIIAFFAYLVGIVRRKKSFDLNAIVPLLLSCAATVAAVKMMILAFSLPRVVHDREIASLFDAGSILVGGFVFMVTALYGVIKIVTDAFVHQETESDTERSGNGV